MARTSTLSIVALPLLAAGIFLACSDTPSGPGGFGKADTGTGTDTGTEPPFDEDGGLQPPVDAGPGDGGGKIYRDPETCAEAKTFKSYVGCDYWPTITPNAVWSIFDFAVVVSNVGKAASDITVTGPSGFTKTVQVAPGTAEKIYLPWVTALKGPDTNECGVSPDQPPSRVVPGGAYHVVSSTPVIVYQFNALEYEPKGGPPGKNWSQCPGTTTVCGDPAKGDKPVGCFSYSNDASLLLPSTAMTGNYRVSGMRGDSVPATAGLPPFIPGTPEVPRADSFLAITATADATNIAIGLSATAKLVAGGTITAGAPGSTIRFSLAKAGDVAILTGVKSSSADLSGSLVAADKPVQVIAGAPCAQLPDRTAGYCDHVEESVLPAETLGKRYALTAPTKPSGGIGKHVLRFYGNVNGTTLSYVPSKPAGCPDTLNAGQVVECGPVDIDVVATGTKEFGIAGFLLGSTAINTGIFNTDRRGDPSQTVFPSVEQFRKSYVFLAPSDYNVNYADIVSAQATRIMLDGAAVSAPFVAIGNSGLGTRRVTLGAGANGVHTLDADAPVGVQVLGYGDFTSYQYPAGMNLELLAPPPPPPN
jgi:hypothetical protein